MNTGRYILLGTMALTLCLTACPGDGGGGGGGGGGTGTDTGEDSDAGTGTGTDTETDTVEPEDTGLVEVAGATYTMGCGAGDVDCDPDNPAHDVTVSTFYIERTEVMVTAYEACVDDGGCDAAMSSIDCNYGNVVLGDHPVNCVTWQQATDYCTWKGWRLPTEAEWELAAAGPNKRPLPWGTAAADCNFAHMFKSVGDEGDYGCLTGMTSPVEAYMLGVSVAGALQMAGNVDEWVSDWYAEDYYESGENTDPTGPATGNTKVNRGGDLFDASSLNLRVFERRQTNPEATTPEHGFRCASDTP